MLMKLDDHDINTCCTEESTTEAMQAVAAKLRDSGIIVHVPDIQESCRLKIVNAKRARSEIAIEDCGQVSWDYWPLSGSDTNPSDIAVMVLEVLGVNDAGPLPDQSGALTLKGAVGNALRTRGLDVSLQVFEDEISLEVLAGIETVNPDMPARGLVRITDDGWVTWECQHDGTASQCARAVADTVVPILTHGIGERAQEKRNSKKPADPRPAQREPGSITP